jgi:hypothetical protein
MIEQIAIAETVIVSNEGAIPIYNIRVRHSGLCSASFTTAVDATMASEVPCNLTPWHPPRQAVDSLPNYGD